MITIVVSFTRPSLDVAFFTMPTEYKDAFMTKYRYTGKSTSTTVSANGLQGQFETVWPIRANFEEFLGDPLADAMRIARAEYCAEHGITIEVEATFVPSLNDPATEPSA
jgi:hypothetical protein